MSAPQAFLRRLLVATDGLADGDRAVTYAIALARRYESEVTVCYAVENIAALGEGFAGYGDGESIGPQLQYRSELAKSILRNALARIAAAGIDARGEELEGSPAAAIGRYAMGRPFDALVMGTHGRSGLGRVLAGSAAESVLRRSTIPAFVVPPGADGIAPAFDRILVAIDGSDSSTAASDFAVALARGEPTRLIYCDVADTDDAFGRPALFSDADRAKRSRLRTAATAPLAAAVARARARDVAAESVLPEGDPCAELLRAARADDADCVVLGTHGRTGLDRWIFGSVAENVARHSPVAVAIVRTAAG